MRRCAVRGAGCAATLADRAPRTADQVRPLRLLSVIVILASCSDGSNRPSRAPAPVEVGRPAPAYRAVTANGDSVSLDALRGKPVLLNVWATWCRPCRDEIPALQRLHERYAPRGLQLVGVSVDATGDDAAIREFMRRYGMTYPVWRDPVEHVSAAFLVIGVPATFLIDGAGILRWKKTGPIGRGDSALTTEIERALQESLEVRS